MTFRIALPQNTDSELLAFEATCDRLAGFDEAFDCERVEGLLASLAAAPQLPPAEAWVESFFGETFDRVFADPPDRAAALKSLQRRLAVLCAQLDPEALFDDPTMLRLEPLVLEWTDADRQRLIDEEQAAPDEVALLQTGVLWAQGFMHGVSLLPDIWRLPDAQDAAELFERSFESISVLTLEPGNEHLLSYLEAAYPKGAKPDREELFAEACGAVQDLRMYWVDFAPRGSTRRVEATPGRNDPCPCGSGKKFKKCHGA